MINLLWFIIITIAVWLTLFIIGSVTENLIKTYFTYKAAAREIGMEKLLKEMEEYTEKCTKTKSSK